jgi:spore maturation protein A
MIGKCFGILCIISIIYAIFTGNIASINDAILSGATKSVSAIISLLGIMVFWQGTMAVFEKSGLIKLVSKVLRPVLRLVFPRAFKSGQGAEEITLCVSANLLGIANASTPLAISAIDKLSIGHNSDKASNDMIMLSVLGSCCFCLVPTTVIALRVGCGASITYSIIVPVWIVSGACMLCGIILSRIVGKLCGDV